MREELREQKSAAPQDDDDAEAGNGVEGPEELHEHEDHKRDLARRKRELGRLECSRFHDTRAPPGQHNAEAGVAALGREMSTTAERPSTKTTAKTSEALWTTHVSEGRARVRTGVATRKAAVEAHDAEVEPHLAQWYSSGSDLRAKSTALERALVAVGDVTVSRVLSIVLSCFPLYL